MVRLWSEGWREEGCRGKIKEEENSEMGGAAKTEGVGFNQQQAVGNEITIPPLSD